MPTVFDFYKSPEKYQVELNPEYSALIHSELIRRSNQCDVDIFSVFESLGSYAEVLYLIKEDPERVGRLSTQQIVEMQIKFHMSFGILIKYLYPLNEQFETLVDKSLEIKEINT